MEANRPYVSLPVAARELRVGRSRVILMIRGGQLKAKLCGTRWWVERASLDERLRLVRWAGNRGAA